MSRGEPGGFGLEETESLSREGRNPWGSSMPPCGPTVYVTLHKGHSPVSCPAPRDGRDTPPAREERPPGPRVVWTSRTVTGTWNTVDVEITPSGFTSQSRPVETGTVVESVVVVPRTSTLRLSPTLSLDHLCLPEFWCLV